MSDTKALEIAAIAQGLRKTAVEMNDMSRRMSAYAVKHGDAEFAKHAGEMAGAAIVAVHWADSMEKRG